MLADYLEHELQARCPSHPRRPPPKPPAPVETPRAFRPRDALALTFHAACARVTPELRALLTETCRRLSAEHVELQSLRSFLLAAAQPQADAEHIADGARLFTGPAFVALEAAVRNQVADAYAGAVLQRGLRRVLLEL